MFTMPKNFLVVNWKAIDGSARQRKMLRLRRDTNGKFMCFIEGCLHTGFKSNRGLRKHIDARHPWYYYFDKEPSVKREVIEKEKEKLKSFISRAVSFNSEFPAQGHEAPGRRRRRVSGSCFWRQRWQGGR